MGEVICLHEPLRRHQPLVDAGPDVGPLRRVVGSFRSCAEAVQAAGLVVPHLRLPAEVTVNERRTRFASRLRFDLAVDAEDADRAIAVLTIAEDPPR